MEASLFPSTLSLTHAVTSLSVGRIVEHLVGRVAFSNGYKKRPVCCFRVMVAFFLSSQKLLFWCLDYFETWVTSADVCCASEHKDETRKPSQCIQLESISLPVSLMASLKCKKSQVKSSFCGMPHPPPTPRPGRIKTVQFHINSPGHVAFDLACRWKLSVFSTDHKESQFSSPCKWETGSSLAIKGLIVSR